MIILNLTNFLGPLTVPTFAGLIGLFSGLYFERYKNRIIVLTHTISFQSLGTAIRNDFWGNITISHNGREIGHLSFVTINIKNNTRSDTQSPITFEAWLDKQSQFLGQSGFYDTGNTILLEQKFADLYNKTVDDLAEDQRLREANEDYVTPPDLGTRLNYLLSNRKMTLPVFNRKTSVTINFLVENVLGQTPEIFMSVLEKGIKLIREEDKTKTENIKKIVVGVITLIAYIIGLIWVYDNYQNATQAITSTILVGTGSYFIGYGIYYLFIYLKKVFW